MNQTHEKSFFIILSLIFLLPIFFVPGGALGLATAKSALLSVGVILATLAFLSETWRDKVLNVPWHPFVLVAASLPVIYFLSALLSTPSSLSLFGYNFEAGTFGFMLFVSALLLLIATVFADTSRILKALSAFFIAFSLIAVFSTVKILSQTGNFLAWGNFFGKVGNPIGSWTDLGVAFGLLSVFSILALGMVPMKRSLSALTFAIFTLSTALLVVINFSTALIFTLAASVVLLVYFSAVEKHFGHHSPSSFLGSKSTWLPVVLGIVSIVFLMNPVISPERGTLGNIVSRFSGVANTEVSPSFSATLSISREAISRSAFLGSGPNTFSRDWLIYRPVEVNTTPFWGASFLFGRGFVPTQIASTGIVGTAVWFIFFALLILLGVKALAGIPESRGQRFALVSSLVLSLFLWAASFLYAPSPVILTLAFVFTGLFVAALRLPAPAGRADIISSRAIILGRDTVSNFISTLLIVIVALGALALGFVVSGKTVSSFYFKRALELSNTPGTSLETLEALVNRTIRFAPADIHYAALSRINFAKARIAATNAAGEPEENLAIFETAISKSVEAARAAVAANPSGYENWLTLGMVYSFLVPEPLSIPGAYENATFAYREAEKRNPFSPEIPLLQAQLEMGRGEPEAARSLIRKAITLKEDYADAYLLLARLETQEDNTDEAIASAERLALLLPGNPSVYFELGFLKYSNEDYGGAADAFSSALSFAPDYANARYFLGLSLIQLGRPDQALEQFEALSVTNPDSEEVRSILEELRDGS